MVEPSSKEYETALALLHEHTKSESLLRHALSVSLAMRWYAKQHQLSNEDQEKWAICGLLHDFDYELYPQTEAPNGHPYWGCALLKDLGYDPDIITAILGHAHYTGIKRESLMAKTLFAVDEASGFVVACALVRPDKSLANLEVKSVTKKMKDKYFAKGCNREDMVLGSQEIGVALDQHFQNIIQALREGAVL